VTVKHGKHLVAEKKVRSGHTFVLSVPAGSYEVTSTCAEPHLPHGLIQQANKRLVTVAAGGTSRISLQCLVSTGNAEA
jgi:hypothetical protein